jgi:hypothetical protein
MDRQSQYYRQVQLLLRIIPFVSRYDCFALKGGTAINLFVRDFPRLSVDIDLVFLPMMERQMALKTIKSHLDTLAASITANIDNTRVVRSFQDKADALRLLVEQDGIQIKIELSLYCAEQFTHPESYRSVRPLKKSLALPRWPS